MSSFKDRIAQWKGKEVYVEGTFPLPTGNGQVAYSPVVGKLIEVFDDGIELGGEAREIGVYPFATMRSCNLMNRSNLTLPKSGIIGA